MPQITVDLPSELYDRLTREAKALGKPVQQRVLDILEPAAAPAGNLDTDATAQGLAKLHALIQRIPSVGTVAVSKTVAPYWWAKFQIDTRSPVAWHVVQELGFVLNYLSLEEPLSTVFMPVSPPPYLNGGPEQFLSWAIEPKIPFLDPGVIADILEDRLPQPMDDERAWLDDEGNDEDEDDVADDEDDDQE